MSDKSHHSRSHIRRDDTHNTRHRRKCRGREDIDIDDGRHKKRSHTSVHPACSGEPLSPIQVSMERSGSVSSSCSGHSMSLRPRLNSPPHPCAPDPVTLLNERAMGKAAAGNYCNQLLFMQLFGLVDEMGQLCESDGIWWKCPLSDQQATLLATAARHVFLAGAYTEGQTDGYVLEDDLSWASSVIRTGESYMCSCVAHKVVTARSTPFHQSVENIKMMIRAPLQVDAVTGNDYTVGLLREMFRFMDMPEFKPSQTGRIQEVSYTLIKNGCKHHFRGVPDYLVHKDKVAADRILVATGEVQSTNLPEMQHSIYGVGKLLETYDSGRPILCISLFKHSVHSVLPDGTIWRETDQ